MSHQIEIKPGHRVRHIHGTPSGIVLNIVGSAATVIGDDGSMWILYTKHLEIIPDKKNTDQDDITEITNERGKNYGHPLKHFNCTQSMYNAWCIARNQSTLSLDPDKENGIRHGVYMILDKLARMSENPNHKDNIDDIQGYARCIQMVLEKQ